MSLRIAGLFLALSVAPLATAQQAVPQPVASPAASPAQPNLDGLQQTAQSTVSDLSRLRIEKWKTDSATKQQAQEMAGSVSRNLNSALPDLIQNARTQPASLAAQFKLYHNLTALYETLASLTETAGAFGGKQEYDALSSDANRLDAQRRSVADYVQTLAAQNDSEIHNLRSQLARVTAEAAAAPPKKIVVDEDTPPAKPATTPRKKTTSKKNTSKPPAQQQPPE
jgi:hypothetical protein